MRSENELSDGELEAVVGGLTVVEGRNPPRIGPRPLPGFPPRMPIVPPSFKQRLWELPTLHPCVPGVRLLNGTDDLDI